MTVAGMRRNGDEERHFDAASVCDVEFLQYVCDDVCDDDGDDPDDFDEDDDDSLDDDDCEMIDDDEAG